jgi:hypothetical protein
MEAQTEKEVPIPPRRGCGPNTLQGLIRDKLATINVNESFFIESQKPDLIKHARYVRSVVSRQKAAAALATGVVRVYTTRIEEGNPNDGTKDGVRVWRLS